MTMAPEIQERKRLVLKIIWVTLDQALQGPVKI